MSTAELFLILLAVSAFAFILGYGARWVTTRKELKQLRRENQDFIARVLALRDKIDELTKSLEDAQPPF